MEPITTINLIDNVYDSDGSVMLCSGKISPGELPDVVQLADNLTRKRKYNLDFVMRGTGAKGSYPGITREELLESLKSVAQSYKAFVSEVA